MLCEGQTLLIFMGFCPILNLQGCKGIYDKRVKGYIQLCKINGVKLMELMKGDGSMISFLEIKKEDLPEDLFEFLSGLTKFDVEKRFSAKEALTSAWLTNASVPLVSKPPLLWRPWRRAVSGGKRKSRKILKNKSNKNKRSYKSSKKSSKKSKRKRSNKSQKYTK